MGKIKRDKLGTMNKVRINDKRPKDDLAVALDQVVSLSKSTLFNKTIKALNNLMEQYHELPEEEQVRQLPNTVKYNVLEFCRRLGYVDMAHKQKADHIAVHINDENQEIVPMVVPTEYIEVKPITKIDFPYGSIKEIMKDKDLSWQEKSRLASEFVDLRVKADNPDESDDDIDELDLNDYDDDDVDDIDDIDDIDDDELTEFDDMDTKERFKQLCLKYPKNFVNKARGRGAKIGWQKQYRGKIYTPYCITIDPYEFEQAKNDCIHDSTISYKSDSYFVDGLNAYVYFIRTTNDL